ncbi:MAG: hypothetical protein JXB45_10630 [Candidatus Krumholzibacteriota bacterium]|nr:hypothetical protein [Candidatus Krumholzibacteriota bacterium]
MKKLALCLLAVLMSAAVVQADTYIKLIEHTDAYYHHGTMEPGEESENDIWFGDGKFALIDEERHFIIDVAAQKMIIIELANQAYLETALPFMLPAIVSEDLAPRLFMFPTVGEVKKLDETKEINGLKCQAYQRNSWVMYQETRFNDTETVIWATSDLPFDRELAEAYNQIFSRLRNYSEELIGQMKMVEGFQLWTESVRYSEGTAIKSSNQVVEMAQKDPPEGVYAIPEGYQKQERLSPPN